MTQTTLEPPAIAADLPVRSPWKTASAFLRVVVALALGVCWALIARNASAQEARWLYDAGSPWAIAAFAAAWIMPFRSVWPRILGALATLVLGLIVFYLPYPPPGLWLGFAAVAAAFYGVVGWLRARRATGWWDLVLPAAVGGPCFIEVIWSLAAPHDLSARTLPFAIVGIVVSVLTARSWSGRLVAPFVAAAAGAAVFGLIWLIAGGSTASELL